MTGEQPGLLRIGDKRTQADIDVTNGGRVAQITYRGVELLIGPDSGIADPVRWGCYPMVPWAGRVRNGRFQFEGRRYQLPVGPDGHAMHGVGFSSVWRVTGHSETSVGLALQMPSDSTWEFGGSARQHISVGADQILLELEVVADDRRFPVSIGWHPWFRKPAELGFHPTAMYRRVDGVAVDERIDVPPGPWDDCFVNDQPVVALVDGVELRLTSECTDWVVYDQPEHATCIEPQSGPPDAFNIAPRVLEPGETLRRSFSMALGPAGPIAAVTQR